MGDGALGSDHVNYLILRYLQESGHGNAAKALYQDWNRADEYRDPEKLPFASVVKPHELVSIIQDGLFHDQLHATVTNQSRRFGILDDALSRPSSAHQTAPDARPQPNAQPSSRRRSSFARANDGDGDNFPTPAAKRTRRSNASDAHVNGDDMEVDKTHEDAESVSAPAETETAQSDVEPAVPDEGPAIETISAATQTEKKSRTKTETMYWTLDKPDSSILHTMWNPNPAMTSRLLTVGESLCRFYDLPKSADGAAQHVSNLLCHAVLPFFALLTHPS